MDWAELMALVPDPPTITGKAYTGESGYGKAYAAPISIGPCMIDNTRRRVRSQTQDAAGATVVSSTTVYAPPGTVLPPESLVTLPSGVVARVIAVDELTGSGLDVADHVELSLE